MRFGRPRVRRVPRRSSLQRGGCVRVHQGFLPDRLLRRKQMRSTRRADHDGMRLGRQRVWHVCNGTSMHERRLQLRRRGLCGLLRQRLLQYEPQRDELRSGWRRLHRLRAEAGVQCARQMRVYTRFLPQRVL